jgi:HEPN domain-containing protein
MNRAEFQALAIERCDDAKALLEAGRYAAAYYLAGYAIECGFKAVIARKTEQHDFPPKNSAKYYVHDLTQLRDLAGLKPAWEEEISLDNLFDGYWQIVKDWSEESRYQSRGQKEATDLYAAVSDTGHGVLQWLKRNW